MFRKLGLLLCLLLPTLLFAVCEHCQGKDKIYVQMEDVILDANQIWIKNPLGPVGVRAIHVDSFGLYVSQSEDEEQEETWLCPKCAYVNKGIYPGFWGCWRCGFPFR